VSLLSAVNESLYDGVGVISSSGTLIQPDVLSSQLGLTVSDPIVRRLRIPLTSIIDNERIDFSAALVPLITSSNRVRLAAIDSSLLLSLITNASSILPSSRWQSVFPFTDLHIGGSILLPSNYTHPTTNPILLTIDAVSVTQGWIEGPLSSSILPRALCTSCSATSFSLTVLSPFNMNPVASSVLTLDAAVILRLNSWTDNGGVNDGWRSSDVLSSIIINGGSIVITQYINVSHMIGYMVALPHVITDDWSPSLAPSPITEVTALSGDWLMYQLPPYHDRSNVGYQILTITVSSSTTVLLTLTNGPRIFTDHGTIASRSFHDHVADVGCCCCCRWLVVSKMLVD
jgi:hypothetical protein